MKLTEANILAYPDPRIPYYLYTDLSDYATGALLTQKGEHGGEHV